MFNHLASLNTDQVRLVESFPAGVIEEDRVEARVYSAFINVVDKGFNLIESECRLIKNVCSLRGIAARDSFEDVKENLSQQVIFSSSL